MTGEDLKRWGLASAAVLCCAPAVGINIEHGIEAGRSPAVIVAAVACVIGAAICGLAIEKRGSMRVRSLASVLLVVFVLINFANAVGLLAGGRDHARNDAATMQTTRESLAGDARSMRGTLDRLTAELGASTTASLKGDIAAREFDALYARSKRCADATVTESRALCAALERSRAMLSSAVERDRLAGELAALNVQLRAAPVRESVDPQAEAIVSALAFGGIKVDLRGTGFGLTLIFALGIELLAAFGPLLCAYLMPATVPQAAAPVEVEAVEVEPEAVEVPEPDCNVERWASDALIARDGQRVAAKDLKAVFDAWSIERGLEPVKSMGFGLAMTRLGYTRKKIGGTVRYEGVALLGARPVLVASR